MQFCGIDWANDHHDALSIDEQGHQLGSIRVAHSPEGLSQLDTYLQRMAGPGGGEQIACIVETTHGLLIAHLLEQGWPVYPVNPRTVERRRARSGAKTDTIDAYLLAKTGRADFQDLRRLNPDSEQIQELKTLTRDQDALIQMQTRLVNQLTACLKAYYPVVLELFGKLHQPSTLKFLRAYPTLQAARAATAEELADLLKQARYPGAKLAAQRMAAQLQQPGLQWLAVLLIGRRAEQDPPLLAAQRWWTNRGPRISYKRDEEGKLLVELAASWGRAVIHVFDQGFASAFWLGVVLAYHLRFVLRWRKDYQLLDAAGNRRLTWKIAQDKRGWSQRSVWDTRRARWVVATVLVLPVAHPDHREQPLSLVICRSQGRSPWYLLTAGPIETDEQAWQVVFVYVRRWQIELSWKYEKSELAFQSPRLYAGQAREKLLLLAKLAYAFLLTLLAARYEWLRLWLLRPSHGQALPNCQAAVDTPALCPQSLVARPAPRLRLAGCSLQADPGHISRLAGKQTRTQRDQNRRIFSSARLASLTMASLPHAKEEEQVFTVFAAFSHHVANPLSHQTSAFLQAN